MAEDRTAEPMTAAELRGLETTCALLRAAAETEPLVKDVAWRTFALIRAHRKQKAEVERLRAERDNAWAVVREGTANMRAALATVRAERDEARTLAGVRRDLLDEARTKLECARKAGREVEAERDQDLRERDGDASDG